MTGLVRSLRTGAHELVRIDDRVHARGCARRRSTNRHDGRDVAAGAHAEAGLAVDLDQLHHDGSLRRRFAQPEHEPHNPFPAGNWTRRRGCLAAAIRGPGGVGRKQREQRLLVPRVQCRDEPRNSFALAPSVTSNRLRSLLTRVRARDGQSGGTRPRSSRGSARSPRNRTSNTSCSRNAARSSGAEPLEQHQEGDGEIRGQLETAIRRRRRLPHHRLGQPRADVRLALLLERAKAIDRQLAWPSSPARLPNSAMVVRSDWCHRTYAS